MNRIMITGGAGFIGYFLAERLSRDPENEITVIDNLLRGQFDSDFEGLLERKNTDFVQGDLTDPGFLGSLGGEFDYIYHLAAVIGVKNVMKNPDRVLEVNAVSTLNLFNYARQLTSLKKLLFSSTSEIYSGTLRHFGIDIPTAEDVILTIDDIGSERTTYALSKMYGEAIASAWSGKYGVASTIVRYHNVYGPRMGFAHVIPEMFIKVRDNDAVDVPSPDHTRAFCYIDDAIEYTIRACESPDSAGETYHIGNSDEEIRIDDLVRTVGEVMERKIEIRPLPATTGSPARRCPDISKVSRLTGYTPLVPLREGIARTYEWYRDRLDSRFE
ncbi:MAG: NAD-dependent epimerase/dehydratase family protein [Candidatus Krumholzibacteriota bacterium]|nr:NAD-dependent epimerase/dehydratase family protein [Candidatus Krumholzibacteriota bacterium]